MSDELKREVLLNILEAAFRHVLRDIHYKDTRARYEQAKAEIVALIKKPEVSQGVKELKALNTVIKVINRMPEEKQQKFYRTIAKKVKKTQVTEEWIEQKANELYLKLIDCSPDNLWELSKDFIRSLFKEVI